MLRNEADKAKVEYENGTLSLTQLVLADRNAYKREADFGCLCLKKWARMLIDSLGEVKGRLPAREQEEMGNLADPDVLVRAKACNFFARLLKASQTAARAAQADLAKAKKDLGDALASTTARDKSAEPPDDDNDTGFVGRIRRFISKNPLTSVGLSALSACLFGWWAKPTAVNPETTICPHIGDSLPKDDNLYAGLAGGAVVGYGLTSLCSKSSDASSRDSDGIALTKTRSEECLDSSDSTSWQKIKQLLTWGLPLLLIMILLCVCCREPHRRSRRIRYPLRRIRRPPVDIENPKVAPYTRGPLKLTRSFNKFPEQRVRLGTKEIQFGFGAAASTLKYFNKVKKFRNNLARGKQRASRR